VTKEQSVALLLQQLYWQADEQTTPTRLVAPHKRSCTYLSLFSSKAREELITTTTLFAAVLAAAAATKR
jgi:hypothetical protein